MSQTNRTIKSLLFYCISAFGVSLNMKAGIGVSSLNAMNLTFSSASTIKVGTITTVVNLLFLLAYMILTKFQYIKKYFIQGVAVLIFGSFVNFFYYILLSPIYIENYFLNLVLFCVGLAISGLTIGIIVAYDTITFPVEAFCVAFADRTRFAFAHARYSIDVLCITLAVTTSLVFSQPIFLREGTIIAFFLFTAFVDFSRKRVIGKINTTIA